MWRPLSANPDRELRGTRNSIFERPVLIVSVLEAGFSAQGLVKISPEAGFSEVEASNFADSACPVVSALFSTVFRLSSLRSFRFCFSIVEDVPGLNRCIPAERLMRPMLVVRLLQQFERRLQFGFVLDVEHPQQLLER